MEELSTGTQAAASTPQPRAAFLTLGCKVNTYDTEAVMELFEDAGYTITEFSEAADVYVVNTCTVTHMGDRKSRQMLRKARRHNPQAVIVAMGCFSQVAPDEVEAIEEVDIVLGTGNRRTILDAIETFKGERQRQNYVGDIMEQHAFEDLSVRETKGKTRAFIKVQDGCNRYCTYCIVPYARGPVRSRSIAEVVAEVERVVAAGYKEVVITGIHIASWGTDLDGKPGLLTLIEGVAKVPGLARIRLGSLEPLLVTEEFAQGLAAIPQICPHFHLSLQSGSDTVLKRMGRRYSTADYLTIVERLRRHFTLPAITTDIMVGFPGESEAEFAQTVGFVQQVGFYQIHIFKYSPRRGTPAAEYPEQVDARLKNVRARELKAVAMEMGEAFLRANAGCRVPVLFETGEVGGLWEGHTPNYLPVVMGSEENLAGQIMEIVVKYNNGHDYMTGKDGIETEIAARNHSGGDDV